MLKKYICLYIFIYINIIISKHQRETKRVQNISKSFGDREFCWFAADLSRKSAKFIITARL